MKSTLLTRLILLITIVQIGGSVYAHKGKLPEGNVPDAVELAVLEDLYTAMGGSSWTSKTNWPSSWPATATSADYATWFGITVINNDITSISLSNNHLSGSIPSSIGDLTELTYLNLNVNQITGAVPTSIGNLTKLTYLNLCCNQLTSIPDEIGDLAALVYLYLYGNQIDDVIPTTIGDLANLKELHFSQNKFEGSIPSSIGNLTSLTHLAMDDNELEGSIPTQIGNLSSLTHLDLKVNKLSGPIPSSIGNLTTLVYLNICINQLTSIPTTIGNLDNVTFIALYGNKITSIPTEIGGVSALRELYLDQNLLAGTIPSSIGNLTNLTKFTASENQLTGPIPSSIGNLTALTYLDLKVNQLSGPIPTTIGNLTNLTGLLLCCNDLTTFPSEIGNLTNLETLTLYANEITGQIPTSTSNLTKLKTFSVDNNHLTGPIPSLATLTQLQTFTMADNNLTGNVPNIGTLNYVNIQNNKISFSGFLPVLAGFDGSGFQYWNQNKIDEEKEVKGSAGSSLTLTTSVDRSTSPASVYQWFKKVGGVTTALNSASTTGHTVEVPNIQISDEGTQYYYTVTNSAASNLTLTSNFQTLAVCVPPTVSFTPVVEGYTYTFSPSITGGESCTATTYLWDFGDGRTSTDASSSHVFNTTGTYVVTLTITMQCGDCETTVTAENTVEVQNTSICTAIYCDGFGGVGIGTMRTQGFRLSVEGKIRASDIIKVYPQGQWSDFVFEDKYRLRPLSEVEKFIKTNGHLPEIPSAKEVEEDGVELGSMDAKLLQKIEELTLYVIELEKEVKKLKSRK